MITLQTTDYRKVLRIASFCDEISPSWHGSLDPTIEDQEAIANCSKQLDSLVTESNKVECSTLCFTARFRREKEGRGRVSTIRMAITSEKDFSLVRTRLELAPDAIYPISSKEAIFYLHYNGKIARIHMSPRFNTIVGLQDTKDSSYLFDTSTSKIQKMMKKDWNGCFVTMSYSWDEVIPVPNMKPVSIEEKKV